MSLAVEFQDKILGSDRCFLDIASLQESASQHILLAFVVETDYVDIQ